MKVTINRSDLLAGLDAVDKTIASRASLPILGNVAIKANGRFCLEATDLDRYATTEVAATINQPDNLTVSGHKLLAMTKQLPDGAVELKRENHYLTIIGGPVRFQLPAIAIDEFPPIPDVTKDSPKEKTSTLTMEQGDLLRILKLTAFAASTEESRYVLNGTAFITTDKSLTLVATDGRRLAEASVDLGGLLNTTDCKSGTWIVPSKTCTELLRQLGEEGDVTITLAERMAKFTFGATTLITKLIDGNYPNYQQVIPTRCPHQAHIDLDALRSSLERVAIVSDKVKLTFKPSILTVSDFGNPDQGHATEDLLIPKMHSLLSTDAFQLAFQLDYLLEGLKAIHAETVIHHFTNGESPSYLQVQGLDWKYVVMPMRLQ